MTISTKSRGFGMSRFPQTNYATPVVFDDGPPPTYVQIVPTGVSYANYAPNVQDNDGHANRKPFPTDQWLDRHDVTVSHNEEVCSQEIGRALLAAFGAVESDQPAAGPSPTVYRHIFTPMDAETSLQLPLYSYFETLGTVEDVAYPSQVCESLTIKGDGTGRLTMDRSLRGSGKRISPSGADWDVNVDLLENSVDYFYNSQITLVVDDGAPIAYACRYETFTLTITNKIEADAGYRPGCATFQEAGVRTSGMIRQEALFSSRMYDLDFTVRLASGGAEYTALQQQKNLDIVLTAEGGIIEDALTHKLTVNIPLGRYQTVSKGDSNGFVTLSVKAKVLYDVENDEIISVELINDVEAYTA